MNPTRVAYRYLLGGVMEAPPAMHAAILEWVIAVKAANEVALLEAEREESRRNDKERARRFQEFRSAIMALRSAPTSWKAYKAYYDLAWIFGHPGQRWSAKDFQKMTPEKAEVLTKRVMDRTDDYLTRLDYEARQPSRVEQITTDLKRLKTFLKPGVRAGDTEKKFPIDLSGWKYDPKEIEDRIRARLQESAKETLGLMSTYPGDKTEDWVVKMIKNLEDQLRTGANPWKTIKVVLLPKSNSKFSGHWRAITHTLTLTMPYTLADYHLRDVSKTLRHELIHFAQTYLTEMVAGTDVTRAGLPSRKIRTPEYQQFMDPTHPNFDQNSTAVQKVIRQLRQEGVNLRQVDFHSLDDVEFYTKLGDAIAEFKQRENQTNRGLNAGPMSRKEKNLAIRTFVHANVRPETERENSIHSAFLAPAFFRALKYRAKGKWRKAVSELTKAVL